MKKSRKIAKAAVLSAALALVMLLSASAATWNEMRENGVVSDGGIALGDVRDGIVSDVSEENRAGNSIGNGIANGIDRVEDGIERIGEDITGNGRGTARGGVATTDHTGNGTDDGIITTDQTSGVPTTDHTSGAVTTAPMTTTAPVTTAHTTTDNHVANGEKDGGMTAGIIIAVLVVAAVIVVIFLLIPKRKR
ncbi:MAG: hypothetical protein IJX64_03765 [Clostridia bacterium]|nr:hypothetical protein [Clostridia bacterium]